MASFVNERNHCCASRSARAGACGANPSLCNLIGDCVRLKLFQVKQKETLPACVTLSDVLNVTSLQKADLSQPIP
jgi:hypothetical protein